MIKDTEFILPVTQMGPTNCASGVPSSGRLDQKTVEALRRFLQEMTATIQTLSNRHSMFCQSYDTLALEDADVRTSFPSRGSPTSLDMASAAVDLCTNQSDNRGSVHVAPQSLYRMTNRSYLNKLHANSSGMQELLIRQSDSARSTAAVTNGRCNAYFQQENMRHEVRKVDASDMDTGMANFEWQDGIPPSKQNCNKHPLDAKTVHALRGFLEEMKKTIQVWCTRHRLLVQGHGELATQMPGSTTLECGEPPGVNGLDCPSPIQDVDVVVDKIWSANREAFSLASNQSGVEDGITPPAHVRSEFSMGYKAPITDEQVRSGCSQHCNTAEGEALKVAQQSSLVGQLKPGSSVQANESESLPEVSNCTRVVKVVKSPPWLPYGWITEVKTRATGNSAGTTDKYYFDPVSKRRFRSRREVFCFLTTGKRGRYKPKTKADNNEGACGRDSSSAQPTSPYQFLNGQLGPIFSGMPAMFFPSHMLPSLPGPLPLPSASGLFSNLFMPFPAGQFSEGPMRGSLSNFPVPVYQLFQGYRLYNGQYSGDWRIPPPHNDVDNTVNECGFQHSEIGEKHFSADDGGTNTMALSEGLRQTVRPQGGSELAFSDVADNGRSQHTFGKLPETLETIETRRLDGKSRSPQRHSYESGLKLPARKLKKAKPQGKGVLEALGRVICHQSLSFLRDGKNSNLH